MDLSSEDALRLNVLLANKPQAIRIDESAFTLHALTEKGETTLTLNPNCREDLYLRKVRETLSGHALGSPGGYPVYLKRWSRMGQTRDDNLEQLLLLGEPEAVVAVTSAKGLTNEVARRAWWTSQEPDNARRMLQNQHVIEGGIGPELARFLIEYLPFETEPLTIVESLRLVLQPGLISEKECHELWKRCARKPTYYLGFLAAIPDQLPQPPVARVISDEESLSWRSLAESGNPYALMMQRVSTSQGQGFIATALKVMEKPANQDVVTMLLDVLQDYFSSLRPQGDPDLTLEELQLEAHSLQDEHLTACCAVNDKREAEFRTFFLLSGLGYGAVRPVFSKTDSIGSLMRKKLAPVFDPLKEQLLQLMD
ncbi:MAG: sulfur reduction protein DsrS [Candidatus Thiodiazotropha sp. 6PLUC2]